MFILFSRRWLLLLPLSLLSLFLVLSFIRIVHLIEFRKYMYVANRISYGHFANSTLELFLGSIMIYFKGNEKNVDSIRYAQYWTLLASRSRFYLKELFVFFSSDCSRLLLFISYSAYWLVWFVCVQVFFLHITRMLIQFPNVKFMHICAFIICARYFVHLFYYSWYTWFLFL